MLQVALLVHVAGINRLRELIQAGRGWVRSGLNGGLWLGTGPAHPAGCLQGMEQLRQKMPDPPYPIKGVISDTLASPLTPGNRVFSMQPEAVGGKQESCYCGQVKDERSQAAGIGR
jgi:hypothetical protein